MKLTKFLNALDFWACVSAIGTSLFLIAYVAWKAVAS
jgi:hypothetical protein